MSSPHKPKSTRPGAKTGPKTAEALFVFIGDDGRIAWWTEGVMALPDRHASKRTRHAGGSHKRRAA